MERMRLLRRGADDEDKSAIGACTKYSLFFINFLFVVCGAGLTAFGTYVLVLKNKRVHDVLDFFLDPACDMCLAGSVTFALAFFGCLGALREIICCLKIYHYTLGILFLGELTLVVLVFLCYWVPDVRNAIFPVVTFKQAIMHYRDDPDMQNLIDTLQQNLQCCGLSDSDNGFYDWDENVYFNCSSKNISPERCSVPYSCCRTEAGDKINYNCGADMFIISDDGSIDENIGNTPNIYTEGCIKALADWIDGHALVVGGVMLGILLPQIFLIMLSNNLTDMINIQKSKW